MVAHENGDNANNSWPLISPRLSQHPNQESEPEIHWQHLLTWTASLQLAAGGITSYAYGSQQVSGAGQVLYDLVRFCAATRGNFLAQAVVAQR